MREIPLGAIVDAHRAIYVVVVRTPLVPLVPILGVLACLGLMATLPADTWLRLAVWLLIGLVIYFTYGRKHSHLQRELKAQAPKRQV